MDEYQRKMRDEITNGIGEAVADLQNRQHMGNWWAFLGTLQAMTKAGAYGVMLGMSKGWEAISADPKKFDNMSREDYLRQGQANLNIDPGTGDRYMRTVSLYEREDFEGLDEPVLEQLQALPVQWQIRVMQSLGDNPITEEHVKDILSSGSFEQLNERLRLRKGGKPRTGTSFSINPTGEVFAYYDGEIVQGGPVAVWTGRADSREYQEFLKRLGIRS